MSCGIVLVAVARACLAVPLTAVSRSVINSYHNAIHAADVTHAMHVFLVSDLVDTFSVRPLEVFSMLVRPPTPLWCEAPPSLTSALHQIAAAVHDYKHPGLNNKFMSAWPSMRRMCTRACVTKQRVSVCVDSGDAQRGGADVQRPSGAGERA